MSASKLVSIIIPCYNHSRYLKDTMEGLLAQDYKEIELLICDDCSPDNSYEILKAYENCLNDKFRRVEILKNEVNLGVTKTINKLLSMAKGEYIKIIASDDILMPNAITEYMTFVFEHEGVDIVISNGDKILDHHCIHDYVSMGKIYEQIPDIDAPDLLERVYKNNFIFAPGALVKYSVYNKIGFYDENIAIEDFEFWLRALVTKQVCFSYLDKSLILYRISENSMSSTINNKSFENRRIRFHKAEMEILKKYKSEVSKSLYAEVLLDRLYMEKNLSIDRKLTELENLVDVELKSFDGWPYVSFHKKLTYMLRYAKIICKKIVINKRI